MSENSNMYGKNILWIVYFTKHIATKKIFNIGNANFIQYQYGIIKKIDKNLEHALSAVVLSFQRTFNIIKINSKMPTF